MSQLRSTPSLIRRAFAAIFSFETAFVLYLFAGFYKASDYLAWVPVDLTLVLLLVSLAAGGWVLWKRRFASTRRAWLLVAAMAVFSTWVLLSLLWAPITRYGQEKALQFAVLNGWALAGAALVLDGDKGRLTRFYGALLALALIFSLETMRVYLPHMDVRSYRVLGSAYQAIGRLVGLGFVVALAAFLSRGHRTWQRWAYLTLALLYFFVLLFVGARGPFIAAMLAMALVLILARGQIRRKLLFLAALGVIYLVGSLWMGPSLRTMYRFNVILAHEVGWELPGAQPTPTLAPTPTPPPTPTPKVATTQPTAIAESRTPDAAAASPASPTPVQPKPTPRPRIPSPKEIPNKSVEMRQKGFVNAWRLWLRAPLFGAGVGSFAFYYPADQLRVYPHNMVLEILSELGVVGVGLWLVLFWLALGGFIKRGGWRKPLAIVALGFLTFTLINAMISGDIASNRHVFTALGLLVATGDLWMAES